MKENIAISLHYFVHVVCRQDDHHIQWIWRLLYSRAFNSTRFFIFLFFFSIHQFFFHFCFFSTFLFFVKFVFQHRHFRPTSIRWIIHAMIATIITEMKTTTTIIDFDERNKLSSFRRTCWSIIAIILIKIDVFDRDERFDRNACSIKWSNITIAFICICSYCHVWRIFLIFSTIFFFSASTFNFDDLFSQHCVSVINLSADNMIRQKRKNIETIKTMIKRSKKTEEKIQKTLFERKKRAAFQNLKKILMIDSHLKINSVELIEYLEFFDSNALRRWYEISSTATDFVSEWHKVRQMNFNIKNKTTDSVWIKNDVFEYILSNDSMNFFIEELPLSIHITENIREYKIWLRAM